MLGSVAPGTSTGETRRADAGQVRRACDDGGVDWSALELEGLAQHLRGSLSVGEAERMITAFEQIVRLAERDAESLPCLLAAAVCLLAFDESSSPRSILEAFFRRSVSDETWRDRYLPLLTG